MRRVGVALIPGEIKKNMFRDQKKTLMVHLFMANKWPEFSIARVTLQHDYDTLW